MRSMTRARITSIGLAPRGFAPVGAALIGLALLGAASIAAGCGGDDASGAHASAVLITLDTTRADALGCYGGRAGVTPNLDALARESVLFENARSVAPLTLPAHASMLTGLWPTRHGLRDNGLRALPESATTIAERAREKGLETAAFVSAVVLDRAWGLAQGFDVYDQPDADPAATTVHIAERPSSTVVDAAIAWLRGRDRERPFLLWVHLFDPHSPYEPPPEFRARAGGDAYLGEVAAADAAVGRLLATLREQDALERTLVVVVADHGEALGQHGEPSHSIFCYEPTIRVPLLVRRADGARAGERVVEPASVVDVEPTIASALGLGPSGDVDGESLLDARPARERQVYFESYCGYLNFGWSTIAGCADLRGKYIHSSSPELYRLDADPREKQDLAASEPAESDRYRASIAALTARAPLAASPGEAVDARMRARIQELGYAGAGDADAVLPAPLADTGRPSPRERLAEMRAYYDAILAANAGRRDEAIVSLSAIVGQNPENVAALDILGAYLVEAKRYEEAAAVLERLLAKRADRLTTHVSLGRSREALADVERALAHYRRAYELHPSIAQRDDLARLLVRAGRRAEADALRAENAPPR